MLYAKINDEGVPFHIISKPQEGYVLLPEGMTADQAAKLMVVAGEWVKRPPPPKPSAEEMAFRAEAEQANALEQAREGMSCSRLQGRLALGQAEIARLDAFIDGFPNNWSLRQVVDNALTWRRNSQDMLMLGFALGYTEEKMDETFIRAMAIEA
jgi:uncharacterized small protein (DUF1192 family)